MCTPALDAVCAPIDLGCGSIGDVEQCCTVTRAVCTRSTEEMDNGVCNYSHQTKTKATAAQAVEVSFNQECDDLMVTVCHIYCKEIDCNSKMFSIEV